MKLLTGELGQEFQDKSLRLILVRRLATVALLAVVAMSYPVMTVAQELPPLRENKGKLNNIVSALRADAEIRFISPGWDLRIPFSSLVVAVLEPIGMAQRGLMDLPADTQTLSDFMKKAIETRLAELAVSEEIALHMTTTELQKPTADCGELRMLLSMQPVEVELDGRSVIAVAVRIASWTGAGLPKRNGKGECLGDKGPPWSGANDSIFLVNRGDRDRALAETKQAILEFVDGALLTRLIFSNATARSTVVLWLKEDN
jgi:hypothetical protein